MSRPILSVVTVVRNGIDFIDDTLRSVSSQTYLEREHIIIDGGSTDGTLDVIARYAAHLAQVVSEPDRGIADAFNKGIRAAHGDYVLFLNADDYLAGPNVLGAVAQAITAAASPTLVYGDCQVVERTTRRQMYDVRPQFSRRRFLWGFSLPHPSLFFHRRYFEQYGMYDLSFKLAMDLELLARGVLRESLLHVPVVVSVMRHGGVSTQDRGLAVSETVRALTKNRLISPMLGGFRLRSYYRVRAVVRAGLDALGMYERVSRVRT